MTNIFQASILPPTRKSKSKFDLFPIFRLEEELEREEGLKSDIFFVCVRERESCISMEESGERDSLIFFEIMVNLAVKKMYLIKNIYLKRTYSIACTPYGKYNLLTKK
jgi:hypothetical protein